MNIDINRLNSGRSTATNSYYNFKELKVIAGSLGLSRSGTKAKLVETIKTQLAQGTREAKTTAVVPIQTTDLTTGLPTETVQVVQPIVAGPPPIVIKTTDILDLGLVSDDEDETYSDEEDEHVLYVHTSEKGYFYGAYVDEEEAQTKLDADGLEDPIDPEEIEEYDIGFPVTTEDIIYLLYNDSDSFDRFSFYESEHEAELAADSAIEEVVVDNNLIEEAEGDTYIKVHQIIVGKYYTIPEA